MSHRSFRGLGFRVAGLALGAACALALPASSAHASAPPGRYTVANGTVTDTFTKLVWQQTVTTPSYTRDGAGNYCAGLALAGGGWRVPSVKELMTLVDFSAPAGPTIDSTAFPNTPATYFWSSSPLNFSSAGYTIGFSVDFNNGFVSDQTLSFTDYVRCVR